MRLLGMSIPMYLEPLADESRELALHHSRGVQGEGSHVADTNGDEWDACLV